MECTFMQVVWLCVGFAGLVALTIGLSSFYAVLNPNANWTKPSAGMYGLYMLTKNGPILKTQVARIAASGGGLLATLLGFGLFARSERKTYKKNMRIELT